MWGFVFWGIFCFLGLIKELNSSFGADVGRTIKIQEKLPLFFEIEKYINVGGAIYSPHLIFDWGLALADLEGNQTEQ